MGTAGYDTAIKFGAGRFRQEAGLMAAAGEEIARFGKKIFVLAGPNGWEATREQLASSMKSTGITYRVEIHDGQCSFEAARRFADMARSFGAEEIVGVGGGRIMDLSKCVADEAALGCVTIPTSAATCTAYVSQSLMYHEDGSKDRTWRFDWEPDAVLLDTDVIARCPARYTAAGLLDAMAKKIEILNGRPGIELGEVPAATFYAYRLADACYEMLETYGLEAINDNKNGVSSQKLADVAYANIAMTGLVSNITRGANQTALAHVLYDAARTLYTKQAADALHGEIVAVGLLMQLYYNGMPQKEEQLRAFMRALGMPLTLEEIGIEPSEKNLSDLFEFITASRHYNGTSEEDAQRLREAIREMV